MVVKNVRKPEVKKSAKVERTQNSIEATKNVRVEPQELRFNQSGGMLKVRVLNPTDHLMAIKVKCSDNNLYRVNPVYSFLQPNDETHIDVVRQNGASKVDKLVLVKAIVSFISFSDEVVYKVDFYFFRFLTTRVAPRKPSTNNLRTTL